MQNNTSTIQMICARHGETIHNQKQIICGQQEGKLTPLGQQQAAKIGIYIQKQNIKFQYVYVSDLGRTKKTFSQIMSNAPNLKQTNIKELNIIRQRNGGVLQNLPLKTWTIEAMKDKKSIRQYKPKNGQSWQDVNNRVKKFLNLIIQTHLESQPQSSSTQKKKIFVVTHGGFIMQLHNVINEMNGNTKGDKANNAQNCSLHFFKQKEKKIKTQVLNVLMIILQNIYQIEKKTHSEMIFYINKYLSYFFILKKNYCSDQLC